MIEKVISRKNMQAAYQQVMTNQGSAGVDGMAVKSLLKHLRINREKIVTAVCNGSYLPQAILGVEIPQEQWGGSPTWSPYRDGSLATTSG